MPLKSRALMLAVMTVWLTAIFFIWRGLGQPLPPRPPDPVQPAASAAPAPAPAPAAPVDELADYGPCPDSGSGQGTVKSLSGHYDEQGRYVSLLTVEGRLGAHRVRHLLARSLDKVTYVDFQGNFRLETSLKHEHKGPASLMHLGRHNGFFRYSLNYRPSQAPSHTAVEVRCKDGGLALRYSFGAPQPTAAAAPVMTPVPAPAPTPQPAGFQRCPSQSSALPAGQGIFSGLKGRYDDQGRYVLSMRLDGRLGAAKIRNYLNRPSKNVTAVDFAGTYRVDRLDYWEAAGPARLAQFGLHKGFLRLSLNFRDGQAPAKVDVEFLCRNEELILRYSFEPRPQAAPAPAGFTSTTIKPFAPALAPSAPLEPAAPEALRPEAVGTAVPPAGRPEVETPADLAAERRTAADFEPGISPTPSTSSNETPPPEPAAQPTGRPEVETPADLAAERRKAADLEPGVSPAPPTSPTETPPPEPAAQPAGRPEVETLADLTAETVAALPAAPPTGFELQAADQPQEAAAAPAKLGEPGGFQACSIDRPTGQGNVKGLQGRYDDQGRYLVIMKLDGQLGAVQTRHYLGRPSKNVTAVDVAGTYQVDRLDFLEADGPVRLAQFGRHKGFLRLSLNFRDRQAPQKVGVELFCRGEELVLRYSFEPQPQSSSVSSPASGSAAMAREAGQAETADASVGQGGQPTPGTAVADGELAGYSACPKDQAGRGAVSGLSARYDAQGRYLVFWRLDGQLGEVKARHYLNLKAGNVSAVDFFGHFDHQIESLQQTRGPVGLTRFGRHPDRLRLSLNYRDGATPESVQVETFCRDETVATRFTFSYRQTPAKQTELAAPSPAPPEPGSASEGGAEPEAKKLPADAAGPKAPQPKASAI